MAAEVSSLVRILNDRVEEEGNGKAKMLVTRDLLGGGSKLGTQELDLDSQVPNGWEKRLDLMSGEIYLQRFNSPTFSDQKTSQNLQDLNLPPSNLVEANLGLKFVPSFENQSVCTLDKVKSALERAKTESSKKRPHYSSGSSSSPLVTISSSSPSSSSIKGSAEDRDEEENSSALLFAAGCPSCLLYVLISKRNPRCPRCDCLVPSPAVKKPRLDLNMAI